MSISFKLSSSRKNYCAYFDKMVWNLSKHLSNYVKSYWKNMFWHSVNKVPQEKVTPKCLSEQRFPKSGPKGIHSSSSAHLYSFIPVHNSVKRGWQSKEPKPPFFFQKDRTLCQTQLQLQKHFPVFSFLLVTAVLQIRYAVMNDKEGNSSDKVLIPKLFLLKETLIYSWHMTFMLEESCSLHIIWMKEI